MIVYQTHQGKAHPKPKQLNHLFQLKSCCGSFSIPLGPATSPNENPDNLSDHSWAQAGECSGTGFAVVRQEF